MKTKFLVILFFIISVNSIFAQITGNSFKQLWEAYQNFHSKNYSQSDVMDANFYVGFIFGVGTMLLKSELIVCPKNTNLVQFCDIVGKFIDNHPERLNENAEEIIYSALCQFYAPRPKKE